MVRHASTYCKNIVILFTNIQQEGSKTRGISSHYIVFQNTGVLFISTELNKLRVGKVISTLRRDGITVENVEIMKETASFYTHF